MGSSGRRLRLCTAPCEAASGASASLVRRSGDAARELLVQVAVTRGRLAVGAGVELRGVAGPLDGLDVGRRQPLAGAGQRLGPLGVALAGLADGGQLLVGDAGLLLDLLAELEILELV